MARLFLYLLMFLLIVPSVYAKADRITINIGGVNDSFEKDLKNIPVPQDKTPEIIKEKELLDNLPLEENTSTVMVMSFIFEGNTVIKDEELRLHTAGFTGREVSLRELNSVADNITKLYRNKGYIISYAYIPPQTVENSVIKIGIVEGKVGKVLVEGLTDYKSSFIEKYMEPLKSGDVLNIKNLERRLLLLNSNMDLKVNATLRAGEQQGYSDIVIYAEDTNPYRLSFSVDNYGSVQTNEYRLNGAAMVGNVIKSGDRLAINASMGLDNFNPLELFYGRIDYRLPFGNNGLKAGFAYARSDYRATKTFKPLDLQGFSNDYSLYFEYPILLRSQGTLNLSASFNALDTTDKMLGSVNSHDLLFDISLGLYGEAYPWTGANMYYSLMLYQGLNGFLGGSHYNKASSNPDASGYYDKIYLDFEYHQFVTWFFRTRVLFSAQWISDTTFSPEKFYIGGMYSVRGFDSGLEMGDYGYRLSLEAEFDIAVPQAKVLFFYDRGQVGNANADISGYKDASLDSAGVGFRFYPWKGLSIKLDYGYPLASSRNHDAGWGKIYGRISYDF